MGRLARKEGTIKVIILVLFLSILVACSPIISTTSLIHSIAKGDAFGTATGIFGKFANTEEEQEQEQQVQKKSRAEIMEDLRKVLESK